MYPLPKNPLDAKGLLKKAKSLEVNMVQICDNYPLHKLSESELKEIWATAHEMGISIEVGTRGVEPDHLLKYLDIAEILHAKSVRTIIDNPDERVAARIEQVLSRFAEAKVSIALENNERIKTRELANLIRKVDSPFFGINLDTVNSLGGLERLGEAVEELAPYVINLHFKDFDITRVDHRMGFNIVGRPAGEGLVDIDWLFDSLVKEGKDPKVVLELWPPFLGTIEKTVLNENEWVERSIHFLKRKIR